MRSQSERFLVGRYLFGETPLEGKRQRHTVDRLEGTPYETAKEDYVGHDLGAGGEVAIKSAVALATRCGAALRLVHVVEPLDAYQRISHPLTSPYTLEEIAQKTGARLEALVASPELARLQVEYEVRRGKPFVEIIIAGKAWLADLIVVGGASQTEEPFLGSTSDRILRKSLLPVMVAKKPLSFRSQNLFSPYGFLLVRQKSRRGSAHASEELFRPGHFFPCSGLVSFVCYRLCT